ncbi:MAG: tyrosine--tRNA ligase [Alphaproteobacteria bacterium]|mgnify:FL=1|jgi:tyrosyl-tRNA synthetase|nr:tyrosine--tRNA ligase [Alphaproteobacteria bacterium]MDP7182931.1 tyrosine--tRNA ligase [Alphaproteobacteria bacterium]MDP7190322.1 tyrosine--tRNA ligase [Alphaproteobacteria bacterium]MDP7456536.1 tyrosine--tRNA ligase [Alphaproteobacteria bacterium]HJO89516.1 tyrosine--tRNA ligase [Alphaproteobacteria bacterium]
MISAKSDFLHTVIGRGFLHQCTDEAGLDAALSNPPLTAYTGFDCTANSLHVGSLVPIMLLRLLQRHGHKPIVLIGGGTTRVGDPSGKEETRQLLDDAQIARNIEGVRKVFERFLTFGKEPTDAIMVDNADWLLKLDYIAFLREFGCHFSVNRMLGFDSVKLRLEREQNLSFLEFNYMVLQAYDFLELSRRFNCSLQMGGSDQWGNIISGVDLGRRMDERALFGLTSPLITTASGAKMGKTTQGAVWLNEEQLSAFDYWQFWRNAEDDDVGRFLRLFTDLELDEIARLEKLKGSEINEAKKILATEATALCRGREAAEAARETACQTFEQGKTAEGLPCFPIPRDELESGIPAFEVLCRTELAASNGEARRLIKGGGARINKQVATSETQAVTLRDITDEGIIKVSAGKKRYALIRVVD